jgi:predicted nucleotidyltransferase
MNTVLVNKTDVIATLTNNRDAHKAIFAEANANYRDKVVNAMRQRADDIEAGSDISVYFDLPQPEDHTDDYEEALETLKWEQRDQLELARNAEFQSWMLNKWHWERSFASNTTSYTAGALGRPATSLRP